MHFTSIMPGRRSTILQSMLLLALAGSALSDSGSKALPKRSIVLEEPIPWVGAGSARLLNGGRGWNQGWSDWNGGLGPLGFGPSPHEVANAIANAKQASANVLVAQQHLQAAKENVLNQQRIATEKQTQAVILKQKSQAAATIQRSEAIQQRLAASKAAVAHAAAHAAAATIQRNEHEAAKLGHFSRNSNTGPGHHLLSVASAGNHLSGSNLEPIGFGPWQAGLGNSVGKPGSGWY